MGNWILYSIGASLLYAVYFCGRTAAKKFTHELPPGTAVAMFLSLISPVLQIAAFIAGFWIVPWYGVLAAVVVSSVLGGIVGTFFGMTRMHTIFIPLAVAGGAGLIVRLLQ